MRALRIASLALLPVLFVGCSGGDENNDDFVPSPTPTPTQTATPAPTPTPTPPATPFATAVGVLSGASAEQQIWLVVDVNFTGSIAAIRALGGGCDAYSATPIQVAPGRRAFLIDATGQCTTAGDYRYEIDYRLEGSTQLRFWDMDLVPTTIDADANAAPGDANVLQNARLYRGTTQQLRVKFDATEPFAITDAYTYTSTFVPMDTCSVVAGTAVQGENFIDICADSTLYVDDGATGYDVILTGVMTSGGGGFFIHLDGTLFTVTEPIIAGRVPDDVEVVTLDGP